MFGYDHEVGAAPAHGADSGPRRVSSIEGLGRVFIGRRETGAAAPAGAVLDISIGSPDIRIDIVDGGGETLLRLGPFAEEDVLALWRSLVDVSGLAPMLRTSATKVELLARQAGRLRLGSARPQARYAVLNGRRPRFLVRRKGARMPPNPVVYRAPEIARGERF